jgi:hypothetical protein
MLVNALQEDRWKTHAHKQTPTAQRQHLLGDVSAATLQTRPSWVLAAPPPQASCRLRGLY